MKALVVDDSPYLAQHLVAQLAGLGIEAWHTGPSEAPTAAAGASAIFVELHQFTANGFALARVLASRCGGPLFLITGAGRATDQHWGLSTGARAVLARPLTGPALQHVLAGAGLNCGMEAG